MSKRVIVYVDGLNFYQGLKALSWRRYYWLDLIAFFSKFLRQHQVLQGVNYFSCTPYLSEKQKRQDQFFKANLLDPRVKVYLGALQKAGVTCNHCQRFSSMHVEKESDVRLASRMILDVVGNRCDVSILVSGDRDFLPTIQAIHELKPKHKIIVLFPPRRNSVYLKGPSNGYVHLEYHEDKFLSSLLPQKIEIGATQILQPQKWT